MKAQSLLNLCLRWLMASAAAATLFTIAVAVIGCGSTDCNDTATCPDLGADVVVINDTSIEASDDSAAGMDDTRDASDDTVAMTDAVDSSDGLETSNGNTDATDALGDASEGSIVVNDADATAPPETGVDDAEAGMDVAEAAVRTCKSNPLPLRTAVASSQTGNLATDAIDKNFNTRWESNSGDPQWIYIDLGAPVFIDRVQILWLHACGADYDLQISNTPSNWVTVRAIVGNATGNSMSPTDWSTAVDHNALGSFGRYLRVYGRRRCDNAYGYSMWEIQISGDPNASCIP